MAQRPRNTSPGDATGRKKAELAAEQSEQSKARGEEIALANAEKSEQDQNAVFDPATGEVVEDEARAQTIVDAENARAIHSIGLAPGTRQVGMLGTETDDFGNMTVDGQSDLNGSVQTNDTAIIGAGPETPFQVLGASPEAEKVRRKVGAEPTVAGPIDYGVQVVESPTTTIRVNADLEQVTIGLGNTFTFEEGKQYRVPQFVADHLEERGYVWH